MASDKKVINGVEYDLQGTNWQAEIDKAVAKGDTNSAAQFEAARNEKINSQAYKDSGGKQTTTNKYQSSGSSSSSSKGSSSSSGSSSSKSNPNYNAAMKGTGGAVKEGDYTVYYDQRGYVLKKVKDGGAGANTVDPAKNQQLQQLAATDKYIAAAIQAAQKGEWDAVGVALNNYTHNSVGPTGGDPNGPYGQSYDSSAANNVMSLLGDVYGYNPDKYYKDKYESVYGEGSWDGTAGTNQAPTTQAPSVQAPSVGGAGSGAGIGMGGAGSGGSITGSGSVSGGGSPITGGSLGDYLEQWFAAAKEQQQGAIDYTVSQGINELTRAEEDAQKQFQTQRNQIDIDEAKAKDNQALYAEARGDKGGIGAAQYDSIMNTAAKNHQAVNQAQTKLSTDTARQIADLRAQGEFEKADKLLQLTQQYLGELLSLEKWGLEYQLSIDKFNAELQQWAKEFELAVSDVTGVYNGMPTLNALKTQYAMDQDAKNSLASAGETLLGLGILPSASQLEAMGMTSAQAQEAITAAKMAAAAKTKGTDTGAPKKTTMTLTTAKEMADAGQFTDEVLSTLRKAGYTDEYIEQKYGYANIPLFESRAEAVAYLESRGKSAASLMTQSEWVRHKNSGNDTSGASACDSYAEYLHYAVKYAIVGE